MQNSIAVLTQLWLRLSLIKGRSPAFWLALLEHYKLSIIQLFELSKTELLKLGLKATEAEAIVVPDTTLDAINEWVGKSSSNMAVSIGDENYPQRLLQLDSPPLVLFCTGNVSLLKVPQIAIVGSRKATLQGLNTARRFGTEIGEAGVTVTSGLALGIDGAAHQGAYATAGGTIAVLGGGLDKLYPSTHQQLSNNILTHNGCIISEFLPWESVKPYHFPRRNRLIAALAAGVLLIEAKIKSGSMITASLAAELDTEVFATPGNINNPLSEGPHYLIQQGAKLVTVVEDIFTELGWQTNPLTNINPAKSDTASKEDPILKFIGGEAVSIDQLVLHTGEPVEALMLRLVELELQGIVTAVPGGYARAL